MKQKTLNFFTIFYNSRDNNTILLFYCCFQLWKSLYRPISQQKKNTVITHICRALERLAFFSASTRCCCFLLALKKKSENVNIDIGLNFFFLLKKIKIKKEKLRRQRTTLAVEMEAKDWLNGQILNIIKMRWMDIITAHTAYRVDNDNFRWAIAKTNCM